MRFSLKSVYVTATEEDDGRDEDNEDDVEPQNDGESAMADF